jgi:hypothetical protein
MKKGHTLLGTGYTHFAIIIRNGKQIILSGWDYRGYDHTELMSDKRHYFIDDLIDWEMPTKNVKIIRRAKLDTSFIRNSDNWFKQSEMTYEQP